VSAPCLVCPLILLRLKFLVVFLQGHQLCHVVPVCASGVGGSELAVPVRAELLKQALHRQMRLPVNKNECVAERSKALPSDGSLVKRREFKSHRTHFCTGTVNFCDEGSFRILPALLFASVVW
jgi:hypothetical protein